MVFDSNIKGRVGSEIQVGSEIGHISSSSVGTQVCLVARYAIGGRPWDDMFA